MHTFILILLWRIIKSLARLASRLQYTEPAVVSPAQKDLHGDWKRVTKSVGALQTSQQSVSGGGFSSPHFSSFMHTSSTNALEFFPLSQQQHDQHDHIYGTKPTFLLLNDLSIAQVGVLLTYHKIRSDAFVAEGVNGEILSEIVSIEDLFQYDNNIKHAPARVLLRYLESYRGTGVPHDRLHTREVCKDMQTPLPFADSTASKVLKQRTDECLTVNFTRPSREDYEEDDEEYDIACENFYLRIVSEKINSHTQAPHLHTHTPRMHKTYVRPPPFLEYVERDYSKNSKNTHTHRHINTTLSSSLTQNTTNIDTLYTRTYTDTSQHLHTQRVSERDKGRIPIWVQPSLTWSGLGWTSKACILARMVSLQEFESMDEEIASKHGFLYNGKIGSFLWRPMRRVRANQGHWTTWRCAHYTGPRRRPLSQEECEVRGGMGKLSSIPSTSLLSSFTIPSVTQPFHITRSTITVNFLLSYTSRTSPTRSHCTTRGFRRRVANTQTAPLLFTLTPHSHTKHRKALIHIPLSITQLLHSFIRLHAHNIANKHKLALHIQHQENLCQTRKVLSTIFYACTRTRTRTHAHARIHLHRVHRTSCTHMHTPSRAHTYTHAHSIHSYTGTLTSIHDAHGASHRAQCEGIESDEEVNFDASGASYRIGEENYVGEEDREGVG